MQYKVNKQQGMTLISLVFVLTILGFLVLCALKAVPIYMNHGKVVHALESLKNRPDIETKSKREIWRSLQKQFDMNYIKAIKKEDVIITKASGGYLKVQIKYHVKEPFIQNLSLWADFDDFVEVGSQ